MSGFFREGKTKPKFTPHESLERNLVIGIPDDLFHGGEDSWGDIVQPDCSCGTGCCDPDLLGGGTVR